ncbi:cache domain-containing protein [Ramlibacter sp. MAHUQ-53]|uniref:cache domain-containing protein n=1 Tax=unclassified Ramlibacter TaxID=2617605 RepID=UPI00362E5B51
MNSALRALFLASCVAATGAWAAGERATKADAEAMVAKGVAALKAKGDAAFVEMTAPSKTFADRDLYLVVYDMNGKCLAHGQNAKQVGKDLLNLKDPDGKEFVKERVSLASSKGKFWQDYKFTDPLTKTIQPKQMYCEKVGSHVVCGGIYK